VEGCSSPLGLDIPAFHGHVNGCAAFRALRCIRQTPKPQSFSLPKLKKGKLLRRYVQAVHVAAFIHGRCFKGFKLSAFEALEKCGEA
jgi:hypothetical protein